MKKHPLRKLTLLIALGAGYVLGARAGRERYEQIADGARRFAGNPKVQAAAEKAQETVAQQAPLVASAVKEKATSAASSVQEKVSGQDGAQDDHATQPHTAVGQPLS
jgi:hypothetical protein